ncbi:MAG: GNAT family N-acetyltransferase, partial [Candidatus Lindowbacteria bacterium]|nr:GNAT family N-acetyltransferase [Candidatus Lindowbacteria bacterium]
ENLSEWFDEYARRIAIPIDLMHQSGFLALDQEQAVGFATYFVYEGSLHIGWLGVKKDRQRNGIGTALIHELEMKARELGIPEIALYTLGDAVDYPPYEQTRRFYLKNGFKVYQRSTTDNPGCLEEIRLSKKVAAHTIQGEKQ